MSTIGPDASDEEFWANINRIFTTTPVVGKWKYPDEDEIELHDGRILKTHGSLTCNGQVCVIHNQSAHHMQTWPLNWRWDRGIMERMCHHGIGHPDPDDYRIRTGRDTGTHGCDGCCRA